MAGIPNHSSAPINPQSPILVGAPYVEEYDRTTSPSLQALNSAASGDNNTVSAAPSLASTAAATYTPTTPTRTIPPPPTKAKAPQSPPPPQPGQAPSPVRTESKRPFRPSYAEPPRPLPEPLPQLHTSNTNYPSPSPRTIIPNRGAIASVYDLSHPPGYQQDHKTSFEDRGIEEVGEQQQQILTGSPGGRGQGILDGAPLQEPQTQQSPIWDTAVSWAKAAGKRLSQTEMQLWKAVNGEK